MASYVYNHKDPRTHEFWEDLAYDVGKYLKSKGKATSISRNGGPGEAVVLKEMKEHMPYQPKDYWAEYAKKLNKYDYFDPDDPKEGLYQGRYVYTAREGNYIKPTRNIFQNFMYGMAGAERPTDKGYHSFTDITTGQGVFSKELNDQLSKKPEPKPKEQPKQMTVEEGLDKYHKWLAEQQKKPAEQSTSAFEESGRPRRPQPDAPTPPAPLEQPRVMTESGAVRYQPYRRRVDRPILPGAIAQPIGPIRRGNRGVEQADPFDYKSYLSGLANLRFNF